MLPLKFIKYLVFTLLLSIAQLTHVQPSYAAEPACFSNTPGQMTNRFTDQGDGTVLDNQTKLIWQRCNLGQVWDNDSESCLSFTKERNWRESLSVIKQYNDSLFASNLADDWRMPNIKELASIIDLSCTGVAIDTNIFINAQFIYWSSTPSVAGNLLPGPNASVVESTAVLDGSDNLIGYQDENLIWTLHTQTGRDAPKAISNKLPSILVRGPSEP